MQTRSRAEVQSLSNPEDLLESSGTRPPSSASDEEGDLGLATMLGECAVSDVGETAPVRAPLVSWVKLPS